MVKNKSEVNNKKWIIGGIFIAAIGIAVAAIIVSSGNKSNDKNTSDDSAERSGNSHSSGELLVADSGWSYVQDPSWGNHVWYGIEVKNENEGKVGSFPKVKVIARDAENKILFSDEFTCNLDYIYPGETLYCGGNYGESVEKPAKVEFKPSVDEWQSESTVSYPRNTDFVVKNISERTDNGTITYTGEIFNNSNVDIHSANIVVIYRKDGKIVGGYMSYSDRLSAHSDDTFEMYVNSAPDYDSYELSAHVSMIN